jgi:hypothetical protein
VREVEEQRRHRDEAVLARGDVGAPGGRVLLAHRADPVIGHAARIDTLDQLVADLVPPLARDHDALDRVGEHVGEVDVDQRVRRPARLGELADHLGRMLLRGRPLDRVAALHLLAQRDRRHAEHRRFHRRGDGARVDDVLAEIAAAVDAGEAERRLVVLEDVVDREQHAVGRRAVDREAAALRAADAQRRADGERMADRALLGLGRHHPDVLGERARDLLERLEAGGVDTVVVGDEDAGAREIERRVEHQRPPPPGSMTSRPPMYGTSASGTWIAPSWRWQFSMTAIIARPTAMPEPLSVWTKRVPLPSAGRIRAFMRRAWKSPQFEQLEISR